MAFRVYKMSGKDTDFLRFFIIRYLFSLYFVILLKYARVIQIIYLLLFLITTFFRKNLSVSPLPMIISRTMVEEIADSSGDDKIKKSFNFWHHHAVKLCNGFSYSKSAAERMPRRIYLTPRCLQKFTVSPV